MAVEVVPQEIRAAARDLQTCVSTVRSHTPTEVGRVAGALPGSTSAGRATALAGAWRRRFGRWARSADDQVEAMRTAADNWDETDHTQAARQERVARMMGPV